MATLACGAFASRRGPESPPFPSAEPQNRTVAALLIDAAWRTRADAIRDGAGVDRRALYVLLGRSGTYEHAVSPLVRAALVGDTTEYEKQPARPPGARSWTVRSASVDVSGRATVVAELHYKEQQHSETYTLTRGLVAGRDGWVVTEIRISHFTFY